MNNKRKKAIFGLGNYGENYINTRHNIGFELLERIFNRDFRENWSFSNKKEWEVFSSFIEEIEQEIFFVKIKGFINNSGVLIKKFMKNLSLGEADIIIIQDDITMEFGKVRLRNNSSSGGHNGIKSVISELGNNHFHRIKVGVGKEKPENLKEWVIGKFSAEEMNKMEDLSNKVGKILLEWIKGNI